MLAVSMPNSATAFAFVDTATKCFARSAVLPLVKNHSRATRALINVSCVVKLFDATMKSVVSGDKSARTASMA